MMPTLAIRPAVWLAALLFALTANPVPAAPREVAASYDAYWNGIRIGVMTERFSISGNGYQLNSETRPIGLAALLQRLPLRFVSTGTITATGLRPQRFEARRTPDEPPQVTAVFDWDGARLTFTHDGRSETAKLAAGTQDRLSVMYQFMYLAPGKSGTVEFAMTNGRKLDHYRYSVTPDVTLDTALGPLTTVHLVKQREPNDTATEIWLSPRHGYFPVKMLIVERDGTRYEQLVTQLELQQ